MPSVIFFTMSLMSATLNRYTSALFDLSYRKSVSDTMCSAFNSLIGYTYMLILLFLCKISCDVASLIGLNFHLWELYRLACIAIGQD